MADHSDSAPGWDAISAALKQLYGQREPRHYGAIIPYHLGGPNPLNGVSCYKNLTPAPHWHIICMGLTELFDKVSENKELSGWGFEFTFRIACDPDSETPPNWALNFLQNLARALLEYRNPFDDGHTLSLNGPIALDDPTEITAIAFITDPELQEINTPHGRVKFLQIVGITDDELAIKNQWNAMSLLSHLQEKNPLLITNLRRQSLLKDPEMARRIQAGVEAEGSSCGQLNVVGMRWKRPLLSKRIELILPALIINDWQQMLRGRILHGRPFALVDDELIVEFEPADVAGASVAKGSLTIALSRDTVDQFLQTVKPLRGIYKVPSLPHLTVRVEPTVIRNTQGEITQTIG